MKRSTDRILTMHAGSLPRPDDLRELVPAKASAQPYEEFALPGGFGALSAKWSSS